MTNASARASQYGLEHHGIKNARNVFWNLSAAELFELAVSRGEGLVAEGGPLVVRTGQHTGRSAGDKFIVRDGETENSVWWDKNKSMTSEQFARLHARIASYLQGRDLFVQDVWGGADPDHRIGVRVINETAWHNLFAGNLLINTKADERPHFKPDFTIISAPGFQADPAIDGSISETVIALDFSRRIVLVAGTSYAGEVKKSVFSILNYLYPEKGIMPMHCSANVGSKGDTAVFFGLSGTGKTTLSADSSRTLIGDDEHGWSDKYVFNFEGGCYAKVIKLSPTAEPEIYATTRRFGTVLENVVIDPLTRKLDLDSAAYTENTRAAYPLSFIPNASETGLGGQPRNIIFLTADAFGVLPPISKLTPAQAMYHFLSGYTARVAGTEKGVTEPQATFSTCFGAPFMSRHPTVYGNLLKKLIAQHNVNCWLVNTGWTGGVYGVGQRMPIAYTRALLNGALDGSLVGAATRTDPHFGFEVPLECPNVPAEVLNPRDTWADKAAYDAKAREVVKMFVDNFEQFADHVDDDIRAGAPVAA